MCDVVVCVEFVGRIFDKYLLIVMYVMVLYFYFINECIVCFNIDFVECMCLVVG